MKLIVSIKENKMSIEVIVIKSNFRLTKIRRKE